MARAYQEAALLAFAQDFEVWSAKRPCTQVLQILSDGPYGKLRTWYKQFYNPRAEANEWHAKVDGTHTVKWLESAPDAVIAAGRY
jgi:3-ketosteroid 9alpha-monooxygenase subunit A